MQDFFRRLKLAAKKILWGCLFALIGLGTLTIAYFLWPVSDNQTFWTAVAGISAAVTALSAVSIFFQVRFLQGEDWERRVNGFLLVTDKIIDKTTLVKIDSLIKYLSGEKKEDFQRFVSDTFLVTKRLELVQMLSERGYLDREMFFLVASEKLYDLKQALTDIEKKEAKTVLAFLSSAPKAEKLLQEAYDWFERKQRA